MKSKSITIITIIVSVIISLLLYIPFLDATNYDDSTSQIIKMTLCWLGVAEFIGICITWRKSGNKVISLYTLFMLFFFLFNYGQCIMWAFGLHAKDEIGTVGLYYKLGKPTNADIIKSQIMVLISALMIHVGALISGINHKKKTSQKYDKISDEKDAKKNTALNTFCKIMFPVVVFSKFYVLAINLINAREYGYTALYYNNDIEGANVIFKILGRLFFPVLLGLLFSSNYNKKTQKIVYATFAAQIILSIAIGDRGGWLYSLIILIICHHKFYRPLRIKQLVKIGITGYITLIILIAVRNIRDYGVTAAGIIDEIGLSLISPITETLKEMGNTMSITVALMMRGWNIFPYGNSFIYGAIIAPSRRIIEILNLNYMSIDDWFSQGYLKISNGAGFSLVGEVLINFGPYALPIIMIVAGVVISKIINIDNLDYKKEKMKIFYKVITASVLINISRNCFGYNMGEIIYTVLLFYILYSVFNAFSNYRANYNEK